LSHAGARRPGRAYVVATGKGESVAQWFFRRQPDVALEGMHDLRMIIRSPAGLPAVAEMKITAKIRRKVAGIVPYRAQLPERLRLVRIPGQVGRSNLHVAHEVGDPRVLTHAPGALATRNLAVWRSLHRLRFRYEGSILGFRRQLESRGPTCGS